MQPAFSSTRSTRPERRRSIPACASSAIFARSALLALALVACHGNGTPGAELSDAAASPQATTEPAPLAAVPGPPASNLAPNGALDAGPPPLPMRPDFDLPGDVPHETRPIDKGAKESRDLVGYSLVAYLRPSDAAGPPKAAEVNERAIDAAKKKTETRLEIDISQTRARIVLASAGFALPQGSELRARVDRYGHVFVSPDDGTYRVVPPGALRALLGERRLDVAPLAPADVTAVGDAPRRFDARTRRVDVATRAAKATFELATMKEAGEGGSLLCRALLDLMSGAPSTPLCGPDDVPVHAELRWTTRGSLTFDVVSASPRTDLPPTDLAAPPPQYAFVGAPPPPFDSMLLLSRSELAAFRSNAVDVPMPRDAQAPLPESGLVLVNSTDELRFVWIDGAAAAWVAPGGRLPMTMLLRGRYNVQWRTFLGDAFDVSQTVTVPGTSEVGFGDAGR
jgi:hypothetical protein